MGLPAEKIIIEAMQLPAPLRALIAKQLIESLDFKEPEPLSPLWKKEVAKRCREIDEGLVQLIPADTVISRAYAALE